MITVNVKRLVSAIEEANAFKLPDMDAGTDYIYNNIYNRLARNMDVRLSEIDFSAFELEDVDVMRDLYSNVLEANECEADSISCSLRKLQPAAAFCVFV